MKTIKTSEPKWLQAVAQAYKNKQAITLLDDANVGIDPRSDTILQMGRKADVSVSEWVAVVVSLGVAAAGAYLLVVAILDPEPFSKIAFSIGAGAVLVFGGGAMAVKILTNQKPPNVRMTKLGFEINWD